MPRTPITDQLGNDLYAKIECTCGKYPDMPWFKHKITLVGYNDSNFFENVNREPRKILCDNCKKAYMVQWYHDGVEYSEADE